jgi:hypothetical protein
MDQTQRRRSSLFLFIFGLICLNQNRHSVVRQTQSESDIMLIIGLACLRCVFLLNGVVGIVYFLSSYTRGEKREGIFAHLGFLLRVLTNVSTSCFPLLLLRYWMIRRAKKKHHSMIHIILYHIDVG